MAPAASTPVTSETSDSLLAQQTPQTPIRHYLITGALGIMMITVSACLISFNKYLMHKDRFPFAAPLMLLHMFVSALFSGTLFALAPSLYPSLSDPDKRRLITPTMYAKCVVPIGMCFAVQLIFSNTAYLYSTVAFLQMMKEGNLVLVYILSVVVALDVLRVRNVCILVCIAMATVLTIKGEIHFSRIGFALQGTSQLCESSKIVLQGMLLSSSGMKLDALSSVLLMTPVCFCFLGSVFGAQHLLHVDLMPAPAWHVIAVWWPYLALSAMLAFVLNVVVALFMKHSSPVAYCLAGIVKDATIVAAGSFLLGEQVSGQQKVGFSLQLCLISFWSLTKTYPDKFDKGVVSGIGAVFAEATSARRPAMAGAAKGYGGLEGGEEAKNDKIRTFEKP